MSYSEFAVDYEAFASPNCNVDIGGNCSPKQPLYVPTLQMYRTLKEGDNCRFYDAPPPPGYYCNHLFRVTAPDQRNPWNVSTFPDYYEAFPYVAREQRVLMNARGQSTARPSPEALPALAGPALEPRGVRAAQTAGMTPLFQQ